MKQRLFIDVKIYDDNMRKIYSKHHILADKAMREMDKIINKKIKGI